MRNNQERFGSFQSGPTPAVSQPSFSFVTPTEMVDLPSSGKYYPQGHPLCDKSSVEIREMTAKEEDILVNRSFIDKGIVLDKLLASVLVDKSIDPQSLLTIDKNAILLATRISGYGASYPVRMQCADCDSESEALVDLNELLKIKQPALKEDVEYLPSGLVSIVLPSTKWVVQLKPLNGYDQERLEKTIENRRKNKLEENVLVETLVTFIHSINGVEDYGTISGAVVNMPAKDSKYLRTLYPECFPSISTLATVKCEICSSEVEMEVPFTLNFFWPK
jgi:hypothetical protein